MADRKRDIRHAAAQLFAERGFEGAGTREIAEKAGVSASLLHGYYGSKMSLFKDILAEEAGDLRLRLSLALSASIGMGRSDRLLAAFNALIGWAGQNPVAVAIWADCLSHRHLAEQSGGYDTFRDVFKDVTPQLAGVRPEPWALLFGLAYGAMLAAATSGGDGQATNRWVANIAAVVASELGSERQD